MAEKVIHEVRFIETDDGFRVEIKGDKERMRKMGFGPGMDFGQHKHHGHHGWWRHFCAGPGRGFGFGPWWADEPEHHEEPAKDA